MDWYELKVITTSQASEMVANFLIESGSNGVAIEDPLDLVFLQDDGFGQIKPELNDLYTSNDVFVTGYFSHTKNITEIKMHLTQRLQEATEYGLDLGKNEIVLNDVFEKDWENAWKKYYYPVRITRFLTVVPSWETYQQTDSEYIISLDPGMAFGTGTHPTTRLSLEALETVLRGGEDVLDVGTGSGVLSIAAKALGAKNVTAYDLDEKATSVARENIALNHYANDVVVKENDLLVGVNTQVDVIVANILAEILLRLLSDAYRNLKPNGHFILSGIIQSKKTELIEALKETGFIIEQEKTMTDWVALICVKPEQEA